MKLKAKRVTDEMVERGARAAYLEWVGALTGDRSVQVWDDLDPDVRGQLLTEARTCIQAALEPA